MNKETIVTSARKAAAAARKAAESAKDSALAALLAEVSSLKEKFAALSAAPAAPAINLKKESKPALSSAEGEFFKAQIAATGSREFPIRENGVLIKARVVYYLKERAVCYVSRKGFAFLKLRGGVFEIAKTYQDLEAGAAFEIPEAEAAPAEGAEA